MTINKIPLLGTGSRISDLPTVLEHMDTFQVFLDNPVYMRPFEVGQQDTRILHRAVDSGATGVIHCSFCTAVLSEGNQQRASLRAIWAHIEYAHKFGIKYVVAHPGPLKCRGVTESLNPGKKTLFGVSQVFSQRMPKGVHLLWENSAGSENGERGLNAADLMCVLARLKGQGITNVGLCCDTQHYYASGCDLRVLPLALGAAEVIHLNGNAAGCAAGSYIDNHSRTSLDASYGLEPQALADIVVQYKNTPKIMECSSWCCMQSLQWLKTKLKISL